METENAEDSGPLHPGHYHHYTHSHTHTHPPRIATSAPLILPAAWQLFIHRPMSISFREIRSFIGFLFIELLTVLLLVLKLKRRRKKRQPRQLPSAVGSIPAALNARAASLVDFFPSFAITRLKDAATAATHRFKHSQKHTPTHIWDASLLPGRLAFPFVQIGVFICTLFGVLPLCLATAGKWRNCGTSWAEKELFFRIFFHSVTRWRCFGSIAIGDAKASQPKPSECSCFIRWGLGWNKTKKYIHTNTSIQKELDSFQQTHVCHSW